jgi:hypothetical protein
MSLFDRAKQVAGQAASKAKEELEEVQTRRELDQTYEALGKVVFQLVEAGELTHPQLSANVDRIRTLQAQLSAKTAT